MATGPLEGHSSPWGSLVRRKPEQTFADVQATIRNLSSLDMITLATMYRIDRFDAEDTGGGGDGPKPKHSVSDPVGNRVVAKLSGRKTSDPVGSAAKEIETTVFQMRRQSEILVQQREFILNPRDRHRDNVIQHCEACLREVACTTNDRIRSGFCYQCYRAWLAQGKPNRVQFCLSIQANTETT